MTEAWPSQLQKFFGFQVALTHNPILHSRTKHMKQDIFFIIKLMAQRQSESTVIYKLWIICQLHQDLLDYKKTTHRYDAIQATRFFPLICARAPFRAFAIRSLTAAPLLTQELNIADTNMQYLPIKYRQPWWKGSDP
ncbi:hypothetical protein CR513_13053, partial [Mucuna pruriens]